ncbi:MAG: hypothetical protein ACI8Z7_000870 [Candidatus Nanohaloarchaea archaeon]|jgi:hypothetical protein
MADYLAPETVDLRKGQNTEIEGGEQGWSDQGSFDADLRGCIALTAYNPDSGAGGMYHMVAEEMEPADVTQTIWEMWHDSTFFGDPEQFKWYAAGGYPGDADYTESSIDVEHSDRAYLRRIHVDRFFDQMDVSYKSEWLDEDDLMQVSLDMDEEEFHVTRYEGSRVFTDYMFQDNHV